MYRGLRYMKTACVHVPLYCLYSRIITQNVCRMISTPLAIAGVSLLLLALPILVIFVMRVLPWFVFSTRCTSYVWVE